ncbi:hypothetical protein [Flammeovirga kamogawensis]|uniref:Uncharacterized protein n=1 Tax=Flammeovirga kamogawensis TaxID=373891 RepID=A0ABX8H116_9BACT|nr:hypothetical protein [Flammeovirga kamogawensis]MBB6463270.1 hypothetical protein [Flammeovirga kamogawensis]QWG09580.1 hypothetical protein KM029_23515 [Flammeovirga kamogawensis]TRX65095.1 hypothetical protein EO216_21415 [Flammeovirga kamogawensis]
MKYLLLCLTTIMCFSFSGYAQKVKNEKVEFSYVQYPSEPFPRAERNYKIEAEATNQDVKAKKKKEYDEEVAKIDAKYEEELAALRREQAVYDSSSTGSKIASNILLGDKRPELSEIRKGTYPVEPVYPKVIDGSAVVHSKIKLSGLKETDDAPVTIKFTFPGMDYTEAEIIGDSVYHYSYTIKNPVKLTVSTAEGEILYDGFVNNSDTYKTIKYGKETDKYKLMKNWKGTRVANIQGNESSILKDNMKSANTLLNSKYGYVVKESEFKIFMGASKKDIYTDHAEAFNNAILGYNLLENEADYTEAKEYLDASIEAWELSLKEKDIKNKKAKINAKVAGGLHFNLTASYLFTKNFKKVSYHSSQLKVLGEGKYERRLKDIDDFIRDYKSRYKAFSAALAQREE